ncbi:hypothetical protein Tco_0600388 [Tanacetum coccineum]|uniref:Uncharacterized protein n=1 Tax=Tanacetum coccineum TaxID=301880 RepID=A0ABQ4WBL6_9ASTR
MWMDLINHSQSNSMEISALNASLQENVLVITALTDELRKLKGKALADNVVCKHTIDPKMLKIDVEYLNPGLLNNRSAHSDYLKHTQEEAVILREIVEQGDKLVAVVPKKKDKRVRFTEPVHSKLNANYEPLCVKCNGYMLFDNHDLYVLDFINDVNARTKSKSVKKNSKRKVWKPTGKSGILDQYSHYYAYLESFKSEIAEVFVFKSEPS